MGKLVGSVNTERHRNTRLERGDSHERDFLGTLTQVGCRPGRT